MEDEVKGKLRRGSKLTDFGGGGVSAACTVNEKEDNIVGQSENTRGLAVDDKAGILTEGNVTTIVLAACDDRSPSENARIDFVLLPRFSFCDQAVRAAPLCYRPYDSSFCVSFGSDPIEFTRRRGLFLYPRRLLNSSIALVNLTAPIVGATIVQMPNLFRTNRLNTALERLLTA